jgi:hypothetical protein
VAPAKLELVLGQLPDSVHDQATDLGEVTTGKGKVRREQQGRLKEQLVQQHEKKNWSKQ